MPQTISTPRIKIPDSFNIRDRFTKFDPAPNDPYLRERLYQTNYNPNPGTRQPTSNPYPYQNNSQQYSSTRQPVTNQTLNGGGGTITDWQYKNPAGRTHSGFTQPRQLPPMLNGNPLNSPTPRVAGSGQAAAATMGAQILLDMLRDPAKYDPRNPNGVLRLPTIPDPYSPPPSPGGGLDPFRPPGNPVIPLPPGSPHGEQFPSPASPTFWNPRDPKSPLNPNNWNNPFNPVRPPANTNIPPNNPRPNNPYNPPQPGKPPTQYNLKNPPTSVVRFKWLLRTTRTDNRISYDGKIVGTDTVKNEISNFVDGIPLGFVTTTVFSDEGQTPLGIVKNYVVTTYLKWKQFIGGEVKQTVIATTRLDFQGIPNVSYVSIPMIEILEENQPLNLPDSNPNPNQGDPQPIPTVNPPQVNPAPPKIAPAPPQLQPVPKPKINPSPNPNAPPQPNTAPPPLGLPLPNPLPIISPGIGGNPPQPQNPPQIPPQQQLQQQQQPQQQRIIQNPVGPDGRLDSNKKEEIKTTQQGDLDKRVDKSTPSRCLGRVLKATLTWG